MRTAAALIVAASVLVGCGGDDDDTRAAAAVVTSDDGRASLELPPGVGAGDIAIEALDVDGVDIAYELTPSGTTFDEPATLTITNVEAPEVGAVPFVLLDDEVVDGVEVRYADDDPTATLVVPIAHFSEIRMVGFSSGETFRPAYTIGLGAPRSVIVDQPFEVAVRARSHGTHIEVPLDADGTVETIDVTSVRFSGSLGATNATPDEVRDLPARGDLGESYAGNATLRCDTALEDVELTYFGRFTFASTRTTGEVSQDVTSSVTARLTTIVYCNRPRTTTTRRPTTSSTGPRVTRPPPPPPVVSEIRIDLQVPVSTYSVTTDLDDRGFLSYTWRMIGEDCGTPKTPWEQRGRTVRWSHADTPPDSCAHAGRDHDVIVSVAIDDGDQVVTCAFEGSESRVITNPDCT